MGIVIYMVCLGLMHESEKVIGNLIQKRNNLNLVWPKLALSLHSADFTWSEIMRKQITSLTNLKGTL